MREAFAREKKELAGRGWQPTADVQLTAQLANATFAQNGFSLAMSIFPHGTPGHVAIAITHLGNINLERLPVPGHAKLVFPGRAGAAFVTDTPAEEATAACRKMLSQLGWQPYGGSGDTMILKQNGVRLTAQVRPAPGKADRTMVNYSCALMSADLPAPADATRVDYNDQTTELVFDTQAEPSEIVDFYRRSLAKADWKQAADPAPAVEARPALVLANANHDRVTLQIDRVEGKNRVRLKHQTAGELQQPDENKPEALNGRPSARRQALSRARCGSSWQ